MDGGPPPLWATVLAAWGAAWSACWSWCWGLAAPPQVAQPPVFSSFGYCGEESGHCSCDEELRRIIGLQEEVRHLQAEVWALRCLLLAGLLLLGVVASGAGTLGFLAGACRRCRCGGRARPLEAGPALAVPEPRRGAR